MRFINILLPLYYLQAEFNFLRGDYEKQLMRLLTGHNHYSGSLKTSKGVVVVMIVW
jgi:hypothetical protein